MEEVYTNAVYKILKVALVKGEAMPRHFAASDAFIIVEKGKAKVSFQDRDEALEQGATLSIRAREPHSLTDLEDFKAFVVLAA